MPEYTIERKTWLTVTVEAETKEDAFKKLDEAYIDVVVWHEETDTTFSADISQEDEGVLTEVDGVDVD